MIEFIFVFFIVMIMSTLSALIPIIFGAGILYIIWRVLKKKEWV